MSSESFTHTSRGDTAEKAFHSAVSEAAYDHGHSGYTGTIAEKDSFVMIPLPEGEDPYEYAEELIGDGDVRIDNKWGPAGCIDMGDNNYLFFGWASS